LTAGPVTISCGQPGPLPAGLQGPVPGAVGQRQCFFDANKPNVPAATMEWVVEASVSGELIHARLIFNPDFVDNTYGQNAIGWNSIPAPTPPAGMAPKPNGMAPKPMAPKPGKSGHTFKDLVGSDHAEFTLRDATGTTVLQFKADYLSESAAAPSGYASLGVEGGEGKMLVGAASDVVAVSTSLARNLNTCGYGDYLVDSPATDDKYTVNQDAPNWDFRVVYDVWVRKEAFGDSGFGQASVEFVHASPSKVGTHTVDVVARDCPPDWPPYCKEADNCKPPICGDEPDESCGNYPPCVGDQCPKPLPEAGIVF
ncbi:MAG TPA: hypothetical protein VFZ61_33225, partial [Polyangiales bacterium]